MVLCKRLHEWLHRVLFVCLLTAKSCAAAVTHWMTGRIALQPQEQGQQEEQQEHVAERQHSICADQHEKYLSTITKHIR